MKQLILCADMEGASGIFEDNASWIRHGSADWLAYGRDRITFDALAICGPARAKAPALRPPYPFLLALCEGYGFNANPGFLHPVRFSVQTTR